MVTELNHETNVVLENNKLPEERVCDVITSFAQRIGVLNGHDLSTTTAVNIRRFVKEDRTSSWIIDTLDGFGDLSEENGALIFYSGDQVFGITKDRVSVNLVSLQAMCGEKGEILRGVVYDWLTVSERFADIRLRAAEFAVICGILDNADPNAILPVAVVLENEHGEIETKVTVADCIRYEERSPGQIFAVNHENGTWVAVKRSKRGRVALFIEQDQWFSKPIALQDGDVFCDLKILEQAAGKNGADLVERVMSYVISTDETTNRGAWKNPRNLTSKGRQKRGTGTYSAVNREAAKERNRPRYRI